MGIACSKILNSQLGYTLWNWLSALRVGKCQLEPSEFLHSLSVVGFLSAASGWYHSEEQVFSQCVPDGEVEVWVVWLCLTIPGQWNVNYPCILEVKAVSWNKQKFTCSTEGWQIICSPLRSLYIKELVPTLELRKAGLRCWWFCQIREKEKKYKTLLLRIVSFKHNAFFLFIWP